MPPPVDPPVTGRPAGGLRSATGWSYVLTGSRIGTTVVVMFVLARLLGPAEFGLMAMALLLLQLLYKLTQQGFIPAIVQRERLTDDHLNAAFFAVLLAGAGGAALMAALGAIWALAAGEPRLATVCVALAPLVLVEALTVVPQALLQRALRYRAIALRVAVVALLSGAAGIALAVAGAGVWALVTQQVVFVVANAVLLWTFTPWRPSRTPQLAGVRDLWRFSAHSASAGVAMMVSRRADQYLVGILFGPVTMGIYRLAIRLPEMLAEVTVGSLQSVALPALSALQHQKAAFAARLADLQHAAAVFALPALGLLAGTAGPLVDFLGPQWAATAHPMRLLCLWGAASVCGLLVSPALQAIGRPQLLSAISWLRGFVGAVVFVAVGLSVAGSAPGTRASAVAIAATAVELALSLTAIGVLRRSLGGAGLRMLIPTLPPAVAALAGFAAATASTRPGALDSPPLLAAAAGAGIGAVVAAATLWIADPRARTMIRTMLRTPGADRKSVV